MTKKICILAAVLCVFGIAGKITYDKVTEYLALKGLDIIASSSVEDYFDKAGREDEPEASETESRRDETAEESDLPVKTPQTGSDSTPVSAPDGIDPADKAYVMSIYSRYTAAEVSEVSAIMSSPYNKEKRARAKQIVFSKMSHAEYNKIMELARKYGY